MKRPLQFLLCLAPSLAAGWMIMSASSTRDPVARQVPVPPAAPVVDEAMAPLRGAKDRWTAIHAAIQLARSIPPGERQAWLDGARFRHADPLVVTIFTLELEELLFQEDPYALVAARMAADKHWGGGYLSRLAKLDPEKLIAFGRSAADPAQGRQMMLAGMNELVTRDPAATLKLALEFPPPADGKELPKDMVRLLAKAGAGDAEKLLDLADARGDRWRSLLRAAAAQTLVTKDFPTGLKWMAAEPDGAVLFHAVFGVGNRPFAEVQENVRLIAANLASFTPEFVQAVSRSAFTNRWPSSYDYSGAEEVWLAADLGRLGYSAQEQIELHGEILQTLSWHDGAAALKYLADPAMKITPDQRQVILQGLRDRQLSSGQPMPPEMQAILTEAEVAMLKSREAKIAEYQTPKKAPGIPEQFAEVMSEPGSESMLMHSENWGEEQVAEALAYVRNAKPEVLADMVKRMQHTGAPLSALAAEIYRLALVNNIATKKVREELIETGIHWASEEPDKASAWAESLPAGPERLCTIRNIAAQWNAGDPGGATKWIAGLKDPAEAEAAKEAIRIYNEKTKQTRSPGDDDE